MKVIKDAIHVMKRELKEADKLAQMAIRYKPLYPAMSEMLATVARQALETATVTMHNRVAAEIKAYKATGKEVPAVMQALWDYEHEQLMDDAAEVELALKTYREA